PLLFSWWLRQRLRAKRSLAGGQRRGAQRLALVIRFGRCGQASVELFRFFLAQRLLSRAAPRVHGSFALRYFPVPSASFAPPPRLDPGIFQSVVPRCVQYSQFLGALMTIGRGDGSIGDDSEHNFLRIGFLGLRRFINQVVGPIASLDRSEFCL